MPTPALLVENKLGALLALGADPSARRRPRPAAYTPLEDRIAEWMRFVDTSAPHLGIEEARHGDATRLAVMAKQHLVLSSAAALTSSLDAGPPALTVTQQGGTCRLRVDFATGVVRGTLAPEVDPKAYTLGFWPHALVLEPDPVERFLGDLEGRTPSEATAWLGARLAEAYGAG